MKGKTVITIFIGLLINLCALELLAQNDASQSRLFFIHEDVVKPSMVSQYEAASKGVVAKLAENEMTSLHNAVAMTDDYHYLYIYEIPNMAALDQNPWQELGKKMGKEKMDAMWKGYDGTYFSHKSYLVSLHTDLSYNPENVNMTSEAMNFRHWTYYHVNPDKGGEARQIAKRWRDLYESKKVPTGYRLYTGGIGTDTPFYIVVEWAKSSAEFYSQNAKNIELLGEEGKALMAETMAITDHFSEKDGWMRLDLSYLPKEVTAK